MLIATERTCSTCRLYRARIAVEAEMGGTENGPVF